MQQMFRNPCEKTRENCTVTNVWLDRFYDFFSLFHQFRAFETASNRAAAESKRVQKKLTILFKPPFTFLCRNERKNI